MDLRQMKPLTCLALPAVPALQMKPQLSAIHGAWAAWPRPPLQPPLPPLSLAPMPSTRRPLSSRPHTPKLTLASGPLHMLRPAQNSLPGKTVSGLSSTCWLFGKASAASQTCLFYALDTKCLSFSTPRTPHQPKGSR